MVGKSKYITGSERNRRIKRRRLMVVTTAFIIGLALIFFISFFISYNKISGNKTKGDGINSNDKKIETVEDLKKELAEKEDEIEGLKARIEKYEATIDSLKANSQTPSTTTSPKTSNESQKTVTKPGQSTVTGEVYNR